MTFFQVGKSTFLAEEGAAMAFGNNARLDDMSAATTSFTSRSTCSICSGIARDGSEVEAIRSLSRPVRQACSPGLHAVQAAYQRYGCMMSWRRVSSASTVPD